MKIYFRIGALEVCFSAERRSRGYVFTPTGGIPPGAVGHTFASALAPLAAWRIKNGESGHPFADRPVPARYPRRKIADLLPGQKGFTVPWAVLTVRERVGVLNSTRPDAKEPEWKDRGAVLNTDCPVFSEYGGSATLPVWRLKDGSFAWGGGGRGK